CLRAWPPGSLALTELRCLHHLMTETHRAGLTFTPAVLATREGGTWVETNGRLWELTTWLPGRADYHQHPTPVHLRAACTALAQLHGVWARFAGAPGPCPAVRRRIERARAWAERVAAGWRPFTKAGEKEPIHPWAVRAWGVVRERVGEVPRRLAPWAG